ncbi:MAG: putative PEP-binding protein [Planctomycetota bacterium]
MGQLIEFGGEGVGLYRTEFLYLSTSEAPTEEDHYRVYSAALESLKGRPMTVRTLDLGADKFVHNAPPLNERNPNLGCRAVRYCLLRPDIFRTQIRAICRASARGEIRMMIPMICNVEEVHRTLEILSEVQDELAAENIPFNPEMPFGIMVEVPSTALTVEFYVGLVDFFSIGTNDLIQYTAAVDRTNEHVADLYQPAHPAVLRLIKYVLDVSHEHHVPVSVCGEMSADPTFIIFLLGLGLRKFSVPPPLIPEVKKIIRSVSIKKAEEVAAEAMRMQNEREINAYLRGVTREILPTWTFM